MINTNEHKKRHFQKLGYVWVNPEASHNTENATLLDTPFSPFPLPFDDERQPNGAF